MRKQDLKTPDQVGKRKAELRGSGCVVELAACVGLWGDFGFCAKNVARIEAPPLPIIDPNFRLVFYIPFDPNDSMAVSVLLSGFLGVGQYIHSLRPSLRRLFRDSDPHSRSQSPIQ